MRAFTISQSRRDHFIAAAIFLFTFTIYLRTLAPSVVFLFDDTLDFQYSIPRLGIAHQTGYPLYTLLGKIFTALVPLNDAAFRLNLFSALCAAFAATTIYFIAKSITTFQVPRIFSALVFAFGETFWSQAIIAEVYALQMLLTALVLYFALRHASRVTRHSLYALAFTLGLGLAHHRLILLIYPAIAYYVIRTTPKFWRDQKILFRAILLFLAPLLLYLYLPIRGAVGSADGTYENTFSGFLAWITASQYTIFLTSNPFNLQRDGSFFATLFQNQFTLAGLALAAIGFLALWRAQRRMWILLTLAFILPTGFAINYNVADVDVFFLTSFFLVAIFAGAGADALIVQSVKLKAKSEKLGIFLLAFSFFLFAWLPTNLLLTNYPLLDLSTKWDVHDYGVDILSQPLEPNATIIGILGEMTLLRYFQENENLRPTIQTIAADTENARRVAIDRAHAQKRVVYLTRPLKEIEQKFSLASVGPLVRVLRQPLTNAPIMQNALAADFGAARLIGYDLDAARLRAIPDKWHAENGRVVRVTLFWQVRAQMQTDAFVSLKILRGEKLAGQIDTRPVRDAYPTTAWRVGEIIADTYDVPVVASAPPGEYILNVTLYDPQSFRVIGQRDLQTIVLAP